MTGKHLYGISIATQHEFTCSDMLCVCSSGMRTNFVRGLQLEHITEEAPALADTGAALHAFHTMLRYTLVSIC